MAKVRKKTAAQLAAEAVIREQEQADSNELDLGDDGQDAEEDVISELQGLGAGGSYRYVVARVSSKPGERAGYCATYNSGDLSLDAIREQFGGGKFQIRVIDERGKYAGSRTVEIVDLPKSAARPERDTAPAPAALDLQGIAALIAAGKPTGGTDNSAQMMTMMLGMMDSNAKQMQAMMQALAQQTKGPSIAEILTIVNAGKGGGGSEKGAVEMLLQGLELGRSLQGGETGMLDVAKEGLSMIAPLLQQQQEQRTQQRPLLPRPAAMPGAPAPAAAAATVQPATGASEVGMIQKLNWLRQQVGALVHQAERDKDPELYAEVMLDNLPQFIDAADMLARLQSPNAVQDLAQVDGRVLQHAEWFEEFRVAAVAILTAPPEADDVTEAGPGAGDPPGPVVN